jgi:hypothetical protein
MEIRYRNKAGSPPGVELQNSLKVILHPFAVAGLLSEKSRESAENSGKRGAQIIESNEINVLAKTLNQKVGGSIPPRPTSIKSKT